MEIDIPFPIAILSRNNSLYRERRALARMRKIGRTIAQKIIARLNNDLCRELLVGEDK